MITIANFTIGAFVIFSLSPTFLILANPNVLKEPPEDVGGEVDQRGREAMTIFVIIIAIFSFIIQEIPEMPLVATSIILSLTLLITAFMLRQIANLRFILYHIQSEAIVFAALLLFLSMYFIVDSFLPQRLLATILLAAVALAFLQWIIVVMILVNSERKRWNSSMDISRREWFWEELDP